MTNVPDRAELVSAARAEIAAMGPAFDLNVLQRTAAAYLPLLRRQPQDGVRIEQDIAYGPHERHRFDLFLPADAANAPMMIFIHGGGFVGGNKVVNEDIYRNLGLYFARHGVITLIANYRLAPQSVWPAGSEDVGVLVQWARGNAARLGGDGDAVFLFGQSAGAVHVMGYLFSPELWAGETSGVAGGIGMSGVYRAFGESVGPGGLAYFGEDEGRRRADCPLSRVSGNRTPLLIGVMEYDPPNMAVHSFELAAELTRAGDRAPRFAYYAGHNHASTVYGIGSGQDEVGEDILRFIRDVRGAA